MYIEYRCPPRAPVANLISVFKRDVKPFEDQHNITIQVTSNQEASTVRLTFEKSSHITLFLMSHKPRSYTTGWSRIVNTCT
jgi:hypothetical protein